MGGGNSRISGVTSVWDASVWRLVLVVARIWWTVSELRHVVFYVCWRELVAEERLCFTNAHALDHLIHKIVLGQF